MKYPSIPRLDEMGPDEKKLLLSSYVEIFEKMDGVNTQISVSDDVKHGLRSGKVDRRSRSEFPWVSKFDRFFWSNREKFAGLKPSVYFGEFMAPMEVGYTDEVANRFILIDVFDPEKGLFLPYEQGLALTESVRDLMLPAEKLYEGEISEKAIRSAMEAPSVHATDSVKEGIVIKSYPLQIFAKAYSPKHDKKAVGSNR